MAAGENGIRLHCGNAVFLDYTWKFFERALPLLVPLQSTQNGPVIALQIENEYGSYGTDKDYLKKLVSFIHDCGIDVQLLTSDGAIESCLRTGTLPELPATVNYRNNPRPNVKALDCCDTGYENAMSLWSCGSGKRGIGAACRSIMKELP